MRQKTVMHTMNNYLYLIAAIGFERELIIAGAASV
jgi:hypothetical protein